MESNAETVQSATEGVQYQFIPAVVVSNVSQNVPETLSEAQIQVCQFVTPEKTNNEAEDVVNLQKDKLRLEQILSDLNEELCDTRKKLLGFDQNAKLQKREIMVMVEDRNGRENLIGELRAGNAKIYREKNEWKRQYEDMLSRQDESDRKLERVINEKSSLMTAFHEVREEQTKLKELVAALRNRLSESQRDRNAAEFAKQKCAQEKEIFLRGKQWFLCEISARDRKLTNLRMEMIRSVGEMKAMEAKLQDECDNAKQQLNIVTTKLEDREEAVTSLNERIEKLLEETDASVRTLEEKAFEREKAISAYKEMTECAETERNKLKEKYDERGNSLSELKSTLEDVNVKFVDTVSCLEQQLRDRDETIRELKSEIEKVNDLLKSKHQSSVRLTEDEIAEISPAAAAAASLIKNGMSLTDIYRKHCEVVAELEVAKYENKRIEGHFRDFVAEVETKAHMFTQHYAECGKISSANENLTRELQLVEDEKEKLISSYDGAARELSYTKAQLERYQRDNDCLSHQVRHLLHAIETEGLPPSQDVNSRLIDGADRDIIWSSIGELQQANLRLASELREAKLNQNKMADEGSVAEINRLNEALDEAISQVDVYRQQNEKYVVVVEKLQEQIQSYKSSTEGVKTETEFKTLLTRCAEYEARICQLNNKLARHEDCLKYITEEMKESDRIFQDRIGKQFELLLELRKTNGELEVEIGMQNRLRNTMKEHSDTNEISLLRVRVGKLSNDLEVSKNDSMRFESELLQLISDRAQLRCDIDLNNEEISILRSIEDSMQDELSVLRENDLSFERMSLAMDQIQTCLEQAKCQAISNSESKLNVLRNENEELRKLIVDLNEQHADITRNLKMTSDRVTSERDQVVMSAKFTEREMMLKAKEFEALQDRHNELVMQLSSSTVSIGTSVDDYENEARMLRNKNNNLENQLKNLSNIYEDAKARFTVKEKELLDALKLNSTMEANVVKQSSFSEAERRSLRAALQLSEDQLTKCYETISDLRREVARLEQRVVEENLNSRQTDVDAQERICELEKQFHDITAELVTAKSKILTLETQLQSKDAEIAKIESDRSRCRKELVIVEKSLDDVRKELKNREISFAEDVAYVNEIEQKSASEIASLRAENSSIIVLLNESNKTNADNLKKMDEQIKNIVKLTDRVVHLEEACNNSVAQPSDLSASLTTFSTVIHYLEEENIQSVERCMASELQLKHLQADHSILDAGRLELEEKNKKLRLQLEKQLRELAEKNEIALRLLVLENVQAENTSLKDDLKDTKSNCAQLAQAVNELRSRLTNSEVLRTSAENQLQHLSSDLKKFQSQCTLWKDRHTQSLEMLSKFSPRKTDDLNREIDMLKSKLTIRTVEYDTLREDFDRSGQKADESAKNEFEKLQKAYQDMAARFEQARAIGRKYRMQSQILEKEKEAMHIELTKKIAEESQEAGLSAEQESIDIACVNAPSQSLLEQMDAVGQENLDLKKQLEEMRHKLTESTMKVVQLEEREQESVHDVETKDELRFRLKSITSMIQKKSDEIEKLRHEVEYLSGNKATSTVPTDGGYGELESEQRNICSTSYLSTDASTMHLSKTCESETASSEPQCANTSEPSVREAESCKPESSTAPSIHSQVSSKSEMEVQKSTTGPFEQSDGVSQSSAALIRPSSDISCSTAAPCSISLRNNSILSDLSDATRKRTHDCTCDNPLFDDFEDDDHGKRIRVSELEQVTTSGHAFQSSCDTRQSKDMNNVLDADGTEHEQQEHVETTTVSVNDTASAVFRGELMVTSEEIAEANHSENVIEAIVLEETEEGAVQTNHQENVANLPRILGNSDHNEILLDDIDEGDNGLDYPEDQDGDSDDISFSCQGNYDEENEYEEMRYDPVENDVGDVLNEEEGEVLSLFIPERRPSDDEGGEYAPPDQSIDEAYESTDKKYDVVGQVGTSEENEVDVESNEDNCAMDVEHAEHDHYELQESSEAALGSDAFWDQHLKNSFSDRGNDGENDEVREASILPPADWDVVGSVAEDVKDSTASGDLDVLSMQSVSQSSLSCFETETSEPTTSDAAHRRRIRIRVPEIDEPSSSSHTPANSLTRGRNRARRASIRTRRLSRGRRFIR